MNSTYVWTTCQSRATEKPWNMKRLSIIDKNGIDGPNKSYVMQVVLYLGKRPAVSQETFF
jgi:hypothetical protein